MKQNHFAYVAALLVTLLFSECQQPPKPGGPIYYDRDSAQKHIIPIREAVMLQTNFIDARARLDKLLQDSTHQELGIFLKISNAETFNRDIFALLLNQKDASGIRIYVGSDSTGQVKLVMLPVDSRGNDIYVNLLGEKNDEKAVYVPGISSATARQPSNATGAEKGGHCPTCVIDPAQ